jgi:hypothetical protein
MPLRNDCFLGAVILRLHHHPSEIPRLSLMVTGPCFPFISQSRWSHQPGAQVSHRQFPITAASAGLVASNAHVLLFQKDTILLRPMEAWRYLPATEKPFTFFGRHSVRNASPDRRTIRLRTIPFDAHAFFTFSDVRWGTP